MPTKTVSIEQTKASEVTAQVLQRGPALPGELNRRILDIDGSLDGLRVALERTNAEVKKSLLHLAAHDDDLTGRVARTYRQLGELDEAYRSLIEQSTGIEQQLVALSRSFDEHADHSSTQFQELAEGHGQLLERTENLQQKSTELSIELTRSINGNLKTMAELHGQLKNEIDALSQRTQERDDALAESSREIDRRLTGTEENVRAYEVQLLKMQAVDRVLARRADTLEKTATELEEQGKGLLQSTRRLNERLGLVAADIAALQVQAKEQGEQLDGLDERTRGLASTLSLAMGLERKHFHLLAGSVALLLLVLVAVAASQQLGWQGQGQTNAVVQGDLQQLKGSAATAAGDLNRLGAQVAELDGRLSGLDHRVETQQQQNQQVLSEVAVQLSTQADRLDSLQGGIANHRPRAVFGKDGMIHGPQWLLEQPADHYLIQLATVSEKQALYRLAERYGHYLQAELAYVPVPQGYALVYGSFASQAEATTAQSGLPSMIEGRRPRIYPMAWVQAYVAG